MFGFSNPFTALYRAINWRAPSLTLASGAPVNNPFISNVNATTPIVADATGGNASIQFVARDFLGQPDTTNAVRVTISATTSTTSITPVTGTVITTEQGLGDDSTTVTVIPGAGGVVSLTAGFGGAETAKVAIQVRHVIAAVSLSVS